MLRSIGADRVVDYAREDFTRTGERYDVILDVPGNRSIADCRRALTAKGSYLLIGHDGFGSTGGRWIGSVGRFGKLLLLAPFVSQRMVPREAKDPPDRLRRYLRDGSPSGKVVITV